MKTLVQFWCGKNVDTSRFVYLHCIAVGQMQRRLYIPLSSRRILVIQAIFFMILSKMSASDSLNVSTTQITAMGCRQCLPFSVVQLKGKYSQKPHFWNPQCCNGNPKFEKKTLSIRNEIWLVTQFILFIRWIATLIALV